MRRFSAELATVPEYCDQRYAALLGAFPEQNARSPLASTLTAIWLRDERHLSGMVHIIGDGGCLAHIADVATHPDFERQGLGASMLEQLLRQARKILPKDRYLSLIADPDAENLYAKFGFESLHGMARTFP